MPSLLSITVDASSTTSYELAENYQCRITWTETSALTYVETLYFDTVLEPFIPRVGLGHMVGEIADVEERLTRQAAAGDTANVRLEFPFRQEVRRGYASNAVTFYPKSPNGAWVTASAATYTLHEPDGTQITSGSATITAITTTATRTAGQLAGAYASLAWLDTSTLIKAHMEAKGWVRPRLIIDRERINLVIVAFALERMYRAEGGGADSASEDRADHWHDTALTRFQGLGPLSYDSTEDRAADTTLGGWSTVTMRRAW